MNQQQVQNEQLSLILANILNPNQNIRQAAENEIQKLLELNFGQFLINVSQKVHQTQTHTPFQDFLQRLNETI